MKVLLLSSLFLAIAAAQGMKPIVVTGATGKTGSLLYKLLKSFNAPVRALVRSADKAKTVLGCTKCDESEGIFIGDVTKPETLDAVMDGSSGLAIATGASPHCTSFNPPNCSYPEGAYPKDIDWLGGKAQIEAFAKATKGNERAIAVLCSSMGTTKPNSFLDQLGNGQIGFYKLNIEAFLEASGVRHAIVKPCGLGDDEPGKTQLVTGHDDTLKTDKTVARADVARVMAMALQAGSVDHMDDVKFQNLRFDLCVGDGAPTTNGQLGKLLVSSLQPWQRSSKIVGSEVVV
jgi:hypothetical protein